MTRRYINQIGPEEKIDQVFRVGAKQLRPNRNGNLYLQLELTDRTGSIEARMWNATEGLYRSFDNGDYLRVQGATQLFQGALQLIASSISRVDPAEVDPADFAPSGEVPIDRLVARLSQMLRSMSNPHLRNLAECFLIDETLMNKLAEAPAGIKHHHAYPGGLLEHIVNLMEVVLRVAPCYPQVDRDLLLMGAFLHDLGKVDELCYQREYAYSDEGQLVGHLVMGVCLLESKLAEVEKLAGEPVPAETALRLKHMLVSHHGQYDYGSPKLPMTLEAVALYCLDNLDSKINCFAQLMREDPNVGSTWTNYHTALGRKLFKGQQDEA